MHLGFSYDSEAVLDSRTSEDKTWICLSKNTFVLITVFIGSMAVGWSSMTRIMREGWGEQIKHGWQACCHLECHIPVPFSNLISG